MNRSAGQLRVALILGGGAAIATLALFPYLLALKPGALAVAGAAFSVPRGVIVLAQVLQNGVFCLLMAWAGLKLGARLGLGAPWLAAWLYRRPAPEASYWPHAALTGVTVGAFLLCATMLFGPPIADEAAATHAPAAWKGLLASTYGAVVEEIELRAFALGVVAWLLVLLRAPRLVALVIATVVAAILFGAAHLPLAAQLAPLDATTVARIVGYNAFAGLAFGGIYARLGLEHAMLAHFCADIVLHVVPV